MSQFNHIDRKIAQEQVYHHAKTQLNQAIKDVRENAERELMVMFIARLGAKFDIDIGIPLVDIIDELSKILRLDDPVNPFASFQTHLEDAVRNYPEE